MRVLFAGTPAIALPSLEAVARRCTVCGVLTAPDRVVGRGQKPGMSAVKERALELGLTVLQPDRLDGEARESVRNLSPDLLVVVAYGKIFGPKFLSLFSRGGINLHPSLLPKYRGPSPLSAAILAGDAETGITVQTLVERMDAGDILSQVHIPLSGTETTESLTVTASALGSEVLVDVITRLETGAVTPVPQDERKATYCTLITKEDGTIDWNESALTIERKIRAYQPWPGAVTMFRDSGLTLLAGSVHAEDGLSPETGIGASPAVPGKVLGIDTKDGFLVQTGNGILAVRELKLQARKALDWRSFRNGVRDFVGTVLGGRDE